MTFRFWTLCVLGTLLLLPGTISGLYATDRMHEVQAVREYTHHNLWSGLPVLEVDIVTPYPFDKKKIARFIDIEKGQEATPALIRNNIDRLFRSDFFDNIEVFGRMQSSGIVLTFQCTKAYIVEDIRVRGGYTRLPWLGPTAITRMDLLEKIALKRDGAFSVQKEQESVATIKKMFHDDGYWNCQVKTVSHFDNRQRTVRIDIVIDRGKPARIKEYVIQQKRVGIDTLNIFSKQYRFNKWKIYRFRQDKFESDLRKTEQYYKRFEYYKARAGIDRVEYDPETAFITMHLTLDPGPQILLEFDYKRHFWNWYWYQPWINKQNFLGAIFDFAPVELLPFIKRGEVTQRNLEKGSENLETLYRNKGYENVRVSVTRETLDNLEGDRIVYRIEEGKMVRVNRVRVLGSYYFSAAQIKRVMRIKESRGVILSWFTAITSKVKDELNGVFVTDVFNSDLQGIRAMYQTAGFRNCVVSGEPTSLSDDSVDIDIIIDEGIQTTISDIMLIGNEHFSDEELFQALLFKVGNPYYLPLIEQSRINMLLLYESRGFMSSPQNESILITPSILFHGYGSKATIVFSIQEGYQVWFDRPLVTGITETKNKVISRELQFDKYEPYSLAKVLQTREKLYKLGFFKYVTFEEIPLKHPYYSRTVIYKVQDKNSGSLDFGGGWNSLEGWKIFGTIADKNLFERGQYLGLRANVNQDAKDSNVELFFREPYFGNIPIEFNTSMYRRYEDKDTYELWSSGGNINFSRVYHYFYRSTIEYRLENIKGGPRVYDDRAIYQDRMSHEDRLELIEQFPRRISSITPKFSIDTRDNPFLPRKGFLGNIQVECAREFLGSKSEFTKLNFQSTYYYPVDKKSVLVANINLGISADLPIFKRFRLGGPTTMRGFLPDRIGPKDNQDYNLFGNTMALFNLEYRFPFLWGFGGHIFYDTGNLWSEPINEVTSFALEHCVGWGIRYDLPFGPLRIDCGYEVDAQSMGSPVWSFSIGHPF